MTRLRPPESPRRIPQEVVSTIFFFLSRDYTALKRELPTSFALVDRNWFQVWILYNWKIIRRIGRVLHALGVEENSNQIKVKHYPTPESWTRFECVYAPQVEKIIIDQDSFDLPVARVLYGLLQNRYPGALNFQDSSSSQSMTTPHIFPNLQTIRIDHLSHADNESTIPYVAKLVYLISHPKVTQFHIRESGSALLKFNISLDYTYQGHTVCGYGRGGVVEAHISDFVIYGPRKYRSWVRLLGMAFARTSACCLYLPDLRTIRSEIRSTGLHQETILFSHTVRPYDELPSTSDLKGIPVMRNPFIALNKIDLALGIREAMELMGLMLRSEGSWGKQTGYWLLRSIRFELMFPDPYRRDIRLLKILLGLISSCAPFLRELRIIIDPGSDSEAAVSPEEFTSSSAFKITADVLIPLKKCSRMRRFELRDIYPLVIDNEDLSELTHDWPELRELNLLPRRRDIFLSWRKQGYIWPAGKVKSLSLNVVNALAKQCLSLSRYGLLFEHPSTPEDKAAWGQAGSSVVNHGIGGKMGDFNMLALPVIPGAKKGWMCFVVDRETEGEKMVAELGIGEFMYGIE